jgi:hypothetical protein
MVQYVYDKEGTDGCGYRPILDLVRTAKGELSYGSLYKKATSN